MACVDEISRIVLRSHCGESHDKGANEVLHSYPRLHSDPRLVQTPYSVLSCDTMSPDMKTMRHGTFIQNLEYQITHDALGITG